MEQTLLVSGSKKGQEALARLLKSYAYSGVSVASSGAEARRMLLTRPYGLVLINSPLSDEQGDALAMDTASAYSSGVVLITKSEVAELWASKVEPEGVLVVAKPLQQRELFRAIHLVCAAGARLAALKQENLRLKQKLDEVRLVSRAKCILIQQQNMTEEEAHRFLEKSAMDKRCTRKELAMELIRAHEYGD